MKVKEANDRIEDLKRLSNNVRLLNQYFLNKPELDEEIAEATGMNASVKNTLHSAFDELSNMTSKFETAVLESEIGEPGIY